MPHAPCIHAITVDLVATYVEGAKHQGVEFDYTASRAPRRLLTPGEPAANDGHDNVDGAYICRVGDELVSPEGHKFSIWENLASGTFGQVVECSVQCSVKTPQVMPGKVALKIVKNKPGYRHIARFQIELLWHLQKTLGTTEPSFIVHLAAAFVHKRHSCLAFELLHMSLRDVLRNRGFRGLPSHIVASMSRQLLEALAHLKRAKVMHCDLRPENVALANLASGKVKLLDFSSACFEGQLRAFYVQTQFYRAPEVILGMPYDSAIDMWSLGTLIAELHNGMPVFPGAHSHDQLRRITACIGSPPLAMLKGGRFTKRFYHAQKLKKTGVICDSGMSAQCNDFADAVLSVARPACGTRPSQKDARVKYILKTFAEFERDENKKAKPGYKELRTFESIEDIVLRPGFPRSAPRAVCEAEREPHRLLQEFLTGALAMDSGVRWSPAHALRHAHAGNAQLPKED